MEQRNILYQKLARKKLVEYTEMLLYYFKYRQCDPKTLELSIESFKMASCIRRKGDLGMGILVFDVGTSSMKGALLNDKAEILCQFHRKYHPTFYSSVKVTQGPRRSGEKHCDCHRDVGDWCKDQNEEVDDFLTAPTSNHAS